MTNIITQYYLVPPWFSTDLKTDDLMTLNDLEWPFYVCDDIHFGHFADE